jgi:dTDP-4-dehydrorhamnose 3,5-epimerase
MEQYKVTIQGVVLTPKKQLKDSRGGVYHFIDVDSDSFYEFGEAYFSVANYGFVKAWKKHKLMSQNLIVIYGKVKFVLFDQRPDSPSFRDLNEFILDDDQNFYLLTIPNNIWYGFKSLSNPKSIIANVTNLKHDPEEIQRLDILNSIIPYNFKNEK